MSGSEAGFDPLRPPNDEGLASRAAWVSTSLAVLSLIPAGAPGEAMLENLRGHRMAEMWPLRDETPCPGPNGSALSAPRPAPTSGNGPISTRK